MFDRVLLDGLITLPLRRLVCLSAVRIALHTRDGVSGMSMCSTPSGRSASRTAFTTVGGAPIVPDSPMPLMPSGLVRAGISASSEMTSGMCSARGIA